MVSIWIFYCTRNNLPVFSDVLRQMAATRKPNEYISSGSTAGIIWLISDPLWMEQRRSLIWILQISSPMNLFHKGFIGSKIRIWVHRKERTLCKCSATSRFCRRLYGGWKVCALTNWSKAWTSYVQRNHITCGGFLTRRKSKILN